MSKKSISQIEKASTANPDDLLLISQHSNDDSYFSRAIQVSAIQPDLSEYALSSDVESQLSGKADTSSLSDCVKYIADYQNNKTAVTLCGVRKSGEQVGNNSLAVGGNVVASAGQTIAMGNNANANGLNSIAIGSSLSASGMGSMSFGVGVKNSDTYAFTWNGDILKTLTNQYQAHGQGTFNINPKNGLSGFYIGEQSLADIVGDVETLINSL